MIRTLMICGLLASPAVAEPMWDTAETWRCTLERHMRVPGGEAVIEMDPEGRAFDIDFAAGTLSSAFIDARAQIVERSHYQSESAQYNLLIARWPGGDYPTFILHQDGSYWEIAASGTGETGDEAWIAMYRCLPDLPKS